MIANFVHAIEDIGQQQWNRIAGSDYPFMRYEFLAALESTRACCEKTGWQPLHAAIYDGEQLVAVAPLYLKHHSYGEYIFDWAWADAYHRSGVNYYPKLLCAIPYTPVTGPRIACADGVDPQQVMQTLADALKQLCLEQHYSSLHILYPQKAVTDTLQSTGLSTRSSYQYHWFNRDYQSFDDFLGALKSRKRKDIKKERKVVQQQGINVMRLLGSDVDDDIWEMFYHFYQLTYAKRSGHGGYLPKQFFRQLGKTMGEQMLLVLAEQDGRLIAGALNFFSGDTLYGRYWGCIREAEFLHFELCYYQGIEFCIEHKLKRFDAGAQGEHKIQRGFEPVHTWSSHWVQDERFRIAIDQYLDAEAANVQLYIDEAAASLPFSSIKSD